MMKRFFAAFVALMLVLLPVISMAEIADYITYTHADGQYSFMYPSDWIMMSKENVQEILSAASVQENQQLAQMVDTYLPQLQQNGMVMLVSETGMTNVHVVFEHVGMRASDEDLLALVPTLISQLSSALEGIEFVNEEGTIIELHGKNGLILEYVYELSGVPMQGAQVYVPGAANLYIFTYTCADATELKTTSREFGFVLGTFTEK